MIGKILTGNYYHVIYTRSITLSKRVKLMSTRMCVVMLERGNWASAVIYEVYSDDAGLLILKGLMLKGL